MPPEGLATPRRAIRRMVIVCCAWCLAQPATGARPAGYLATFTQTNAIIETSRRQCLTLTIYLADTSEQHRQGLMFIERMDEFEGMLFRYDQSISINMWMKNTYIPLDMLFIREDGYVSGVARDTKPLSTDRISSPEPVSFVLEVNAGLTAEWSIDEGNRLLVIN
jgi:hypothetical protein